MDKYLMKDGSQFTIRQPKEADAEGIINYSKILFASTDQVLTTLEEYTITVDNEKIFLTVFETNKNALKLYKDLGFIEEGRHIKAIKQLNGEYVDTVQMYLETN
jgi:hypothetical protein